MFIRNYQLSFREGKFSCRSGSPCNHGYLPEFRSGLPFYGTNFTYWRLSHLLLQTNPVVSVLPVKSVDDEKSSATGPILVKLVNTRGSFAISVQLVADVDS